MYLQQEPKASGMEGNSQHLVVYQSLHHAGVQVLNDETESPPGSLNDAEDQVFNRRPSHAWWWENGPVDNCCCCFPLGTGIVLLSLSNLFHGVIMFFKGRIITLSVARLKRLYDSRYSGVEDGEACKMLAEEEAEAHFIVSCAPLLYAAGTTLIFFSLLGMRAACTGDPKFAKLFMTAYPFVLAFDVVMMSLRAATAAVTITPAVQINFCLEIFFCVYYFKVTWSFYKRLKFMENMQPATFASAQGHTINLPLTYVSNVV